MGARLVDVVPALAGARERGRIFGTSGKTFWLCKLQTV
jgi:hypothetical protein